MIVTTVVNNYMPYVPYFWCHQRWNFFDWSFAVPSESSCFRWATKLGVAMSALVFITHRMVCRGSHKYTMLRFKFNVQNVRFEFHKHFTSTVGDFEYSILFKAYTCVYTQDSQSKEIAESQKGYSNENLLFPKV